MPYPCLQVSSLNRPLPFSYFESPPLPSSLRERISPTLDRRWVSLYIHLDASLAHKAHLYVSHRLRSLPRDAGRCAPHAISCTCTLPNDHQLGHGGTPRGTASASVVVRSRLNVSANFPRVPIIRQNLPSAERHRKSTFQTWTSTVKKVQDGFRNWNVGVPQLPMWFPQLGGVCPANREVVSANSELCPASNFDPEKVCPASDFCVPVISELSTVNSVKACKLFKYLTII